MSTRIDHGDEYALHSAKSTLNESALTARNRRRPGRLVSINPALLPLLRESERHRLPKVKADDADLQANSRNLHRLLSPGEGILLGLASGAAMWVGIVSVVVWVFGNG